MRLSGVGKYLKLFQLLFSGNFSFREDYWTVPGPAGSSSLGKFGNCSILPIFWGRAYFLGKRTTPGSGWYIPGESGKVGEGLRAD